MLLNILEKLTAKVHMGYVVQDVEHCLECLKTNLHCAKDASTYIFTPVKAYTCGVPAKELSLKIAMCHIKDNVYFEYIQPLSPGGFHYLSLLCGGDNMNHAAFYTDECDSCRRDFEELGAVFVFEAEANDPQNGYRRCFYAKLDGVPGVLEVLENARPYRA